MHTCAEYNTVTRFCQYLKKRFFSGRFPLRRPRPIDCWLCDHMLTWLSPSAILRVKLEPGMIYITLDSHLEHGSIGKQEA